MEDTTDFLGFCHLEITLCFLERLLDAHTEVDFISNQGRAVPITVETGFSGRPLMLARRRSTLGTVIRFPS